MNCAKANRDHRYFVADVAVVPAEGKVVVLALCTACGDLLEKHVQVARPHTEITLKSLEKQNESE
jgi:hypothetical protein